MIRRLLILNGLAAIGAVIYHATGLGYVAMFWWVDRYLPMNSPDFSQLGNLSYYTLRLAEQVVMFSVPAFLFVSGFFIAFASSRNKDTVGWDVIGNRIKSLIIPYFLWTILFILLNFLQGEIYSVSKILKQFLLGQASPPYYFVPLLVQLYLLAPILVRIAKNHSRLIISYCGSNPTIRANLKLSDNSWI